MLRVSSIFVADGVKTKLQGEDGARSGALGLAGGLLASESCNFTSTSASKTCILQRRRIFFKNSLVHAFPLDGGEKMFYCLVEITAALMLYVFILFIICILYRIFVFRKLGERRFLITLLLFFMGAVAMPVCWWQECFIAFFMGMVLSICMATCLLNDVDGWCEMRRRKKLATLPARKLKSCTMSFAVTRDDLLANFRELSEKDELACYEPANNFLSWNDGQGYIIQVHLQPEADSWVAIFYSPSPSELRDSEIKQACGKAKLPCFPGLLGMAPAGLAICQQGQVTITPASQKKHFEEFCGKILAHREHFADWLAEYTENPDES